MKGFEKFIYNGNDFFNDLWSLRNGLFEEAKKEEIQLEKRAIRKKIKMELIDIIDVNFVLFKHDENIYLLSFCQGVEQTVHDTIYENNNFVRTTEEHEPIWKELYFSDMTDAPTRKGISVDIYSNKDSFFIGEYTRKENAQEFTTDDRGKNFMNINGLSDDQICDEIYKLIV